MGPGILIKSVLQGSFSLMVFGWAQIVMDIQPLFVMITGEGHLHGFTHTYLGALIIAAIAALSGKYLSEIGLFLLKLPLSQRKVKWSIAIISALIGSASHVWLDSIMHSDLEPFYPWAKDNPMLGWLSISALHQWCLYSGLLGSVIYFAVQWRLKNSRHE